MVLISRQEFFRSVRSDASVDAFIKVLFEPSSPIDTPKRISRVGDATVSALAALRSGMKEPFELGVALLQKREIAEQTEWVHDDLLVFSLAVANLRFDFGSDLLNKLFTARGSAADEESRAVTRSIEALVNRRKDAPIPELLLVGEDIAFPDKTPDLSLILAATGSASERASVGCSKTFLRLVGEKTAEIVTRIGARDNYSQYAALVEFNRGFDRRAKAMSVIVFIVLFVGTLGVWLYLAAMLFFGSTARVDLAGKFFTLGVVVFPVSVFLARTKILRLFRKAYYYLHGGRKIVELPDRKDPA